MRPRVAWACVLALLAGAAGCSIGQPTPKRFEYALDMKPEQVLDPGEAGVLQINRVRVAALFERKALVYRVSDEHYESDFYHAFHTQPGEWIRSALADWFDASGFFTAVADPTENVLPDWWLEAQVWALYADVRDPKRPQVDVLVEFNVIDPNTINLDSAFRKRYGSVVAIPDGRPENVVLGLRKAWKQIFEEFEEDLRESLPEVDSARVQAG